MPFSLGRICLFMALLLPCTTPAQDAPVEIAIVSAPPYTRIDQDGLPEGPVIELIKRLFADLQQPYRVRDLPPNRVGLRLIKGQAALTIASEGNPGLSRLARQGKEPLLTMSLNVYRAPGTPAINNLADLAGKRVIAISAYSYGTADAQLAENQPATQKLYANSHEAALQMLLHGRADYLLDYAEPLLDHLKQLPPDQVQADHIRDIAMFWYLSRQYPHPELLDRLDQAVSKQRRTGDLQRLLTLPSE
ncbi:substrate-binding periplasmic protein [Halopseudomonas sabulinigri]|uniref:Transporter substrate-binding domain-containing protein n=1 Tax=Halopseudomonas sabulinigri TaxID=472181 RepID=A0ABP9ZPV4_9GAMM